MLISVSILVLILVAEEALTPPDSEKSDVFSKLFLISVGCQGGEFRRMFCWPMKIAGGVMTKAGSKDYTLEHQLEPSTGPDSGQSCFRIILALVFFLGPPAKLKFCQFSTSNSQRVRLE